MSPDDLLHRPARLTALRSVAILDTPREAEFDDLCSLAAHLCQVPIAVVNFIDSERQWFKSEVGLGCDAPPLSSSVCQYAMVEGSYVEFPDLRRQECFATNPLVIGEPHLRFYAGAMLKVDGEVVGSVCVLDFRARHLTEEQAKGLRTIGTQVMNLLDLRRKLRWQKEAGAAKDDFLAKLSHELRTPLTPVLMAVADRLEQGVESDGLRDDLSMILRNVQTEARLIDDLLDVTRITHGKLVLKREVVDLHAVATQAALVCAPQFRERGIVPQLALNARWHWVDGDPVRLAQVFWNLLSNAAKFTNDAGLVEIESEDVGDCIRVSVRDNGRGIDARALPTVFEPFEQGSPDTTRTHGGMGLGLAICKGVLDLHGGTLRVESPGEGYGATFSLELAITPAPDFPTKVSPRAAPHRPLQILLVEDHPSTSDVLSRLLTRRGHEVRSAMTVAAALALVNEHPFDLLISDLGLPDGSGLDLMREIRERHGLAGIALSGYGTPSDVAAAHDAGFALHLLKPVDWQILEVALQQFISSDGTG